jgi:putative DNA primase/helicase
MEQPDMLAFAAEYLRRGWALITLPSRSKKPTTRGWQNERATVDSIREAIEAGRQPNLGVLTGEPSGNLTRVDLDHPAAVRAAPVILPPTGLILGREGNPRSGYLYVVKGGLNGSITIKDPTSAGDEATLIDVLWTGKMSVVPPSIHPSGGSYGWHEFKPAAEVDGEVLEKLVRYHGAASMMGIHWPEGARHDAAMAYCGGMLADGVAQEDVELILRAILAAAEDEEVEDRMRCIQDTLDSLQLGKNVVGWTRFRDMVDDRIIRKFRELVGIGRIRAQRASANASDLRTTDMGNAERLVDQFGRELRYSHPMKKWFHWDGMRWRPDSQSIATQRAMTTVRGIYKEAAAQDTVDKRAALSEWAVNSESASKIGAMVQLARSIPEVIVLPEQLDQNPWLLNTGSGTLDLKTQKLTPHDQGDLITAVTGTDYDPAAECPRWMQFLDEIFGSDDEIIEFVQRAVGYSLTGNTREQVIFLCWGDGANGKSTFLFALEKALNDYAANTPFDTFDSGNKSQTGNELARLKGKRLVIAIEAENERTLAEARVKSVTGGDRVTCRFLYGEFFEYDPEFKIWLAVNHKPIIRGTDHGMWRRIILIPFTQSFKGVRDDKTLRDILTLELPGILAWCVRGLTKWLDVGLATPERLVQATAAYRAEMDVVQQFIDERCDLGDGFAVPTKDIYSAYGYWAKDYGERVLSHRSFGLELARRGFVKQKSNSQIRWRGLKLRPEAFQPAGMREHELN